MRVIVIQILISIGLATIGQVLLKIGVNKINQLSNNASISRFFFKAIVNPYITGGFAIYALSALLWLLILSKADLSFAYPFLALGYIGIIFISWLFLNESISAFKIAGSVVIIIGIIILSRG